MKLWNKNAILPIAIFFIWMAIHLPGVFYGTQNTPLHVSYMSADEQSPVNGALHMLQAKSLFGLRNENTVYYGPVFSIIALPAVVADFAVSLISGVSSGADSYRTHVVWNWGGILAFARLIALVAGFWGLVAVYKIFRLEEINPTKDRLVPLFGVAVTGSGFLYFEYSTFFRHWIFVVSILLWQIYLVLRIYLRRGGQKRNFAYLAILTVISFGISYLSLIFQVIWLPMIIQWIRQKQWKEIRNFAFYIGYFVVGAVLIVAWHPYAFYRIVKIFGPAVIKSAPVAGAVSASVQTGMSSFVFYFLVILLNNLPFILALVILAWSLIRRRKSKGNILVWISLSIFVLDYFVFGMMSHHESRYGLPLVVAVILFGTALYSLAIAEFGRGAKIVRISEILIGISIILNIFQMAGWERVMVYGPSERREIVPLIEQNQKEKPGSKTLVLQSWPLGYVHTKEAYENFVKTHNKTGYDLWKFILESPLPKGIDPINVYYADLGSQSSSTTYDHIYRQIQPDLGSKIAPESPQDIFDLYPWTIWDFKKALVHYSEIK
jgi:hypothetical protein